MSLGTKLAWPSCPITLLIPPIFNYKNRNGPSKKITNQKLNSNLFKYLTEKFLHLKLYKLIIRQMHITWKRIPCIEGLHCNINSVRLGISIVVALPLSKWLEDIKSMSFTLLKNCVWCSLQYPMKFSSYKLIFLNSKWIF